MNATESETIRPLTLGQIATRYGIQLWQVRRLFERNLVAESPRVGQIRVVYPDQLPTIEQALKAAGYLKNEAVSA